MKKSFSVVLFSSLLLLGTLAGCGSTSSANTSISSASSSTSVGNSSSSAQKITVALDKATLSIKVGEKSKLTATTNPVGQTVVFTSSDDNVATVAKDGTVSGEKVGTATITAKTADNLTATCAVTVNAEDIPALPTDATLSNIDLSSIAKNADSSEGYTASYANSLATVSFTAASLAGKWNNYAYVNMPKADYTRKTTLHIVAHASEAMTIYYKVLSDGDALVEGEAAIAYKYTDFKVDFEAAKRYLLGGTNLQFLVYAPKPEAFTKAGSIDIAHAYLNGDGEPGVAPGEYDPSAYTSVYDFPVTQGQETLSGIIYDQVSSKSAQGISVSYGTDGVTFKNTLNYNEWADFSFKCPEYNGDNKIDYTGATKLVAKINASEGADIKFRSGWDATIYEKKITADNANKDIYITLDVDAVVAWNTLFQFAPFYRVSSDYTADLTILVKSISVVKANA